MINAVISLIYTAYALLKSEIETRQAQAADVQPLLKVLHILNAAGEYLRSGDTAGLDATVHALNRAKDATENDELMVVDLSRPIPVEKVARLEDKLKKK